jgi:tetratricopeptide (TPR) repeat protein
LTSYKTRTAVAAIVLVLTIGMPYSSAQQLNSPPLEATRLFNQASAFYSKAEYAKAIILYRKAAQRGGDGAGSAFNIGNCYYQAGDLPAAAASYRRAITLSKGSLTNALFNLASIHFQLQNYGDAVASYKRALAADKDNLSGWLYLAEAYQRTGDRIGAQKALETASRLDPSDVAIVYQRAENHVALGEIAQGIDLVRQAYELNPQESDFLFYIGDLYVLQQQPALAATAYRQALAVDAQNVSGLYRLADVLVQLDQPFLAMEHLATALIIKPDFTDAAIFLGNTAYDVAWYQRALDGYAQALRFGDTEAVYGIVNIIYDQLNRKDPASARKAAKIVQGITLKDAQLKREWKRVEELLQQHEG